VIKWHTKYFADTKAGEFSMNCTQIEMKLWTNSRNYRKNVIMLVWKKEEKQNLMILGGNKNVNGQM